VVVVSAGDAMAGWQARDVRRLHELHPRQVFLAMSTA